MVRLANHCTLAALVLSLVLLTPASVAAFPSERSAPEPGIGVVTLFIEWLTSAFVDIGCSMDPSGRCAGDNLDIGCGWDPDGRCRDTNQSEPPTPEERLDIGCSMDPDGRDCANRG